MQQLTVVEAQQIAQTILRSDHAILGLVLLDEQGRILAGAPTSEMESRQRQMGEELPQMAATAMVIFYSGARAVRFLGKLRWAVFSYETTKILSFAIPRQRYTVAISLTPNARTPSVYKTVLRALKES